MMSTSRALMKSAKRGIHSATMNSSSAMFPKITAEAQHKPAAGIVGLGIGGAIFGGYNLYNICHHAGVGVAGGTQGDTHIKQFRAAKKEAQPLTKVREGLHNMNTHKEMSRTGHFSRTVSFNTRPQPEWVPGDKQIERQLSINRANAGANYGWQMASPEVPVYDDAGNIFKRVKSVREVPGVNSVADDALKYGIARRRYDHYRSGHEGYNKATEHKEM